MWLALGLGFLYKTLNHQKMAPYVRAPLYLRPDLEAKEKRRMLWEIDNDALRAKVKSKVERRYRTDGGDSLPNEREIRYDSFVCYCAE